MRKKRSSYYEVTVKYYELSDWAWQRSTKKNQLGGKNYSQLAKCFHADLPKHLKGTAKAPASPVSSFLNSHVPRTAAPVSRPTSFMSVSPPTLLRGAGL